MSAHSRNGNAERRGTSDLTQEQPDADAAELEFRFTPDDFAFLRRLIKSRTGIQLGERKREMVYGRLARRLRALELDSFDAYCRFVDSADGEHELLAMVNAITTNLTKFFREDHHFAHLAQSVLPDLAAKQARSAKPRLRIWSAGCSSGEEPYTIAMTVLSTVADLPRWDARLLATDLDTEMIRRGKAGRYGIGALESIPPDLRARFTKRSRRADTDHFEMAEELKKFITFKALNLLEPWPMKGPFDVIFCRNVVIYFDRATRLRLFDRFADVLTDGGHLFIGHSESLLGISDRFDLIGKTMYRKCR